MTIYLSLLVALVGLFVLCVPGATPWNRWTIVGAIMLLSGLLAFLLAFAGADVVAFPHRR